MTLLSSVHAKLTHEFVRTRFGTEVRFSPASLDDFELVTDEDIKCEFLDGEIIVHSPASWDHELLSSFLIRLLGDVVETGGLGQVVGPNLLVEIGSTVRLSPDVSFVSGPNLGRVRQGRLAGPVDLAVEILSPSTRRYDRGDKLDAYRQGRVPEIWVIDPDERRFEAHVLHADAYLSTTLGHGRWSSVVIPGLMFDVAWLWRRPLPALAECRAGAR